MARIPTPARGQVQKPNPYLGTKTGIARAAANPKVPVGLASPYIRQFGSVGRGQQKSGPGVSTAGLTKPVAPKAHRLPPGAITGQVGSYKGGGGVKPPKASTGTQTQTTFGLPPGAVGAGGGGGSTAPFDPNDPNAWVNAIFDPQFAALQQQQQAAQSLYGQATSSWAALIPQIISQFGVPYDAAANAAVGEANAAAKGLAAANPNAQVQGDLSAIGAPGAQQAAVAQQLATSFPGNAALLQYTAGAMPADVFAQDAAGRQAFLAHLPVVAQGLSQQGLGDLANSFLKQFQSLGTAKTQALYQAHQDAVSQAAAQQDAQLKQHAEAFNEYVALRELGLKDTQARAQVARDNALTSQGQARVGIAQQQANTSAYSAQTGRINAKTAQGRLREQQIQSDRRYAVQLKQLGISQAKLRMSQQKAAARQSKLTANERATIHRNAEKDAEVLFQGIPPLTRSDGSVEKPGKPPLVWKRAVSTLLARYPSLGYSGAIAIFDALGWAPGEGGRPRTYTNVGPQGAYGVQASVPNQ